MPCNERLAFEASHEMQSCKHTNFEALKSEIGLTKTNLFKINTVKIEEDWSRKKVWLSQKRSIDTTENIIEAKRKCLLVIVSSADGVLH